MNLPDELKEAISEVGAKVRWAHPWWLKPFLLKNVAGITLGRRVYLKEGTDLQLLKHELVHVRQIVRVGFFTFYWRWIVEYVRNRRSGMASYEAYRRISFEEEAFREETYNRSTPA
jgi:hypothetical protein